MARLESLESRTLMSAVPAADWDAQVLPLAPNEYPNILDTTRDGRYTLYGSEFGFGGRINGVRDLRLFDAALGDTLPLGSGGVSIGAVEDAHVSADGTRIAYIQDGDAKLHDRTTASRRSLTAGLGSGSAADVELTADGRRAAFIWEPDDGRLPQIIRVDVDSGATFSLPITTGLDGVYQAPDRISEIALAGDGSRLAYVFYDAVHTVGQSNESVHVYDFNEGVTRFEELAPDAHGPIFYRLQISDDGRYLAADVTYFDFEIIPDGFGPFDVYTLDTQTGLRTLLSASDASGDPVEDDNRWARMSPDGQTIAFGSDTLNPGRSYSGADLIWDRITGSLTQASLPDGISGFNSLTIPFDGGFLASVDFDGRRSGILRLTPPSVTPDPVSELTSVTFTGGEGRADVNFNAAGADLSTGDRVAFFVDPSPESRGDDGWQIGGSSPADASGSFSRFWDVSQAAAGRYGVYAVLTRSDGSTQRLDADGVLLISDAAPIRGDVNGDGVVNLADFAGLAQFFGRSYTNEPGANADLNGDGLVNLADFAILGDAFGR